jgi:hypothetical protein
MIDLKPGVDASGIRPELILGLIVISDCFRDHGVNCTVTAIRDGKHMTGSLHYSGAGADIRLASRYTQDPATDRKILLDARPRLGPQYDLLLETDHFHLEFDPKPGRVA